MKTIRNLIIASLVIFGVSCTTIKIPVSVRDVPVPVSLSNYVSLNKNENFEKTENITTNDSIFRDFQYYYLVLWYLRIHHYYPASGIDLPLTEYDYENGKFALKNAVINAKNKQSSINVYLAFELTDEITVKFKADFGKLKSEE